MKWFVIGIFFLSILYAQLRGKVRHRWMKQVFDHSAFLAPLNSIMYLFSRVPTTPYVSVDEFPGLRELEKHWPVIRAEAQNMVNLKRIKASEHNDDAGFNSFFKEGWKRFYLKWYEEKPPSALKYCPQTVELLAAVPCVKAALFAELPAGAKLNPHRDPYAGSMRYHLGLATPNDERCTIWVDDEPYSWRDGEAVVFDETYIHWVRNDTDQDRLILLCDLERPLRYRWAAWINHMFSRYAMSAAASPNDSGDRTGLVGRLFRVSFVMGGYRRRFKRWNPTVYKLTKVALIVALVAAIIWI